MVVGFTQILSSFVELFGIIYTSGTLLYTWLSSPLVDTAGESASILGEFGDFTPFELMFGAGLIFVLIFSMVRFVMGR